MKKYIYVIIGMLSLLGLCYVTAALSAETRQAVSLSGNATLDRPVFSAESGFYEEPFYLSMSVADGSAIYYTSDGSTPDKNSTLYTEPILIDCEQNAAAAIEHWLATGETSPCTNARPIRAVAVNSDGEISEAASATYFIGPETYSDAYIVSILTDPDNLFGEDGIYVTGKEYDEGSSTIPNYLKTGRDWEREIYLDILDAGGSWGQPAGIRIQGASARNDYAKRFSVFSRKEYSGSNTFQGRIFDGIDSHSFVIRPGFMNAFIQHLVQNRDVASLDAREALVFLNGHFWYPAMIQEKYNSQYFSEHFGVDGKNTLIIKGGAPVSGKEEDGQKYQEIYNFIAANDLADAGAYQKFCGLIDVQSFIDFSVTNVYFGNLDYSEDKNFVCWRVDRREPSPYGDGRWRWAFYDMDLENLDYGYPEAEINTFDLDTHYAGPAFNKRPLYAALKRNADFCRRFVITFMDMINTDFTVANATRTLSDWHVNPAYSRREADWCENYFRERNEKITEYISGEFGLSGSLCSLNLKGSPEMGRIELNTITPDTSGDGFYGRYFRDYPIVLTATPFKGYHFKGWYVDGSFYSAQNQVAVPLTSSEITIEAVYE